MSEALAFYLTQGVLGVTCVVLSGAVVVLYRRVLTLHEKIDEVRLENARDAKELIAEANRQRLDHDKEQARINRIHNDKQIELLTAQVETSTSTANTLSLMSTEIRDSRERLERIEGHVRTGKP